MKNKRHTMLAIILTAACLRIVIGGVGPLLPYIQGEYALSGGVSGLLTTMPLLAFAVVSPVAGSLGKKMGEGRAISLGLLLILAGTLLRGSLGTAGLFLGTALLGAGIAIGNVLTPAVVKSEFPDSVGSKTGIYTVAMSVAAAVSLALSVPMADVPAVGWRGSLAVWAVIVAISWLVWRPLRPIRLSGGETGERHPLLRNPLTWYVTLFFGITSMMFYVVVGWLPTILQSGGMDSTTAGLVTSGFQLIGLPSSFLAPTWAGKQKDQRLVLGIGSAVCIIAIAGLILARGQALRILSALLLGFANGSNFSMGMALFGFRTENAADAARLSAFAQSAGYALAATGPIVVGWIYDLIPNWSICLLYVLAFSFLALFAGIKAGEDKTI